MRKVCKELGFRFHGQSGRSRSSAGRTARPSAAAYNERHGDGPGAAGEGALRRQQRRG
jgi:hypothetical protein